MSRVSVVVIVCSAILCSLPTGTSPICMHALAQASNACTSITYLTQGMASMHVSLDRTRELQMSRMIQPRLPVTPNATVKNVQLHTTSRHVTLVPHHDGARWAPPRLVYALAVLGQHELPCCAHLRSEGRARESTPG